MRITDLTQQLEKWAPLSLQESYDNAGLITGDPQQTCTGVLCALDAIDVVIDEAIEKGCNLVVAHHPILFSGLKKIDPHHYVGRALIKAIRHNVAIYAIHTNLDNLREGVSKTLADRLELGSRSVLIPQKQSLKKLYTFVPLAHIDTVSAALFAAGAGHIGQYDQCSFRQAGEGSFRASEGADPFVGSIGTLHREPEWKLEVIFPALLQREVLAALKAAHPYEEVAFDLVNLSNDHPGIGSGLIGELPAAVEATVFLDRLKKIFGTPVLRFAGLGSRPIKKVALCGGAGSFLISRALAAGADAFLTADLKYHEFFEADGRMLLVDLGHYESEQFSIDLIQSFLAGKFPNFAVLKTARITNPVCYH